MIDCHTQRLIFITAHDGFVMQDLVSYNQKHNEANGEENRDGRNENYSYNHGLEGSTESLLNRKKVRWKITALLHKVDY